MSSTHHPLLAFILLISVIVSVSAKPPKPPKPSQSQQFLIPQNQARAKLGLNPLSWDKTLQNYAESYASKREQDCALIHSNGPYGENIFWGSGQGWRAVDAVAAWLEEKQWYQYKTNGCSSAKDCSHYTQIVWSGSKRLGCAMVNCKNGKGMFAVCEYDPPGNYIGQKPY